MTTTSPPLVFSIYEGMGRECSTFHNRLTKAITEKGKLDQSIVANWIQIKISFATLESALLRLRGSRSISRNVCVVGDNIETAHEVAKV